MNTCTLKKKNIYLLTPRNRSVDEA